MDPVFSLEDIHGSLATPNGLFWVQDYNMSYDWFSHLEVTNHSLAYNRLQVWNPGTLEAIRHVISHYRCPEAGANV
jgi:hypothetical protein